MDTTQLVQLLSDPEKAKWLILLALWTLPWKGVALWRASKNSQLYWFIAILILNTFGIVEIVYLAFFQPKNKPQ